MVKDFDLNKEVGYFLTDDSVSNRERPVFVLVTGLIGVGKTTLRKKKYGQGYVQLDAVDICQNFKKTYANEDPDEMDELLSVVGFEIARRSITERRNIITEIIGESLSMAKLMIDAMGSAGYQVNVVSVDCNVVEAYKRHVNAVTNDPSYLSAHYTQALHEYWVVGAAKAAIKARLNLNNQRDGQLV